MYINYAGTYMEAVTVLENMLNKNTKAVEYLKVHVHAHVCEHTNSTSTFVYPVVIHVLHVHHTFYMIHVYIHVYVLTTHVYIIYVYIHVYVHVFK